jgi:selenocysteine lyase/cysteine desulfurase
MPRPVAERLKREYWDALSHGDVRWNEWLEKKEESRRKLARFIHARPEEIAFVHSTSEGMNLVADLIARQGGVLANTLEFPSSTLPWLHRRVPVRFISPDAHGVIPLEAIKKHLSPSVKTIVTSYVQYRNGFRQDLEALGKMKAGRFLVVNATQGFGVLPIDVARWQADFLCANSYKWFLAGYGGGIVFMKRKWIDAFRPSFAGWRSMKHPEVYDNRRVDLKRQASRYEYGCPPFVTAFTMGAMADYLGAIGMEAIARRVLELTDYLIERLGEMGLEIATPLERKYRSGIVVFRIRGAPKIVRVLLRKRIYVSQRGEGIRVAPHFYNHRGDIDRLLRALKNLI